MSTRTSFPGLSAGMAEMQSAAGRLLDPSTWEGTLLRSAATHTPIRWGMTQAWHGEELTRYKIQVSAWKKAVEISFYDDDLSKTWAFRYTASADIDLAAAEQLAQAYMTLLNAARMES